MLRDDPVEVLLFLVLSPAFGSSLPVVDGGRHGLLARNRQFVDLAHRDRVGREDRHVVVEEHLVGHLREVPSRITARGSVSASRSAVRRPAPEASRRYTTSPATRPYASSAASSASSVNCSTTFTLASP